MNTYKARIIFNNNTEGSLTARFDPGDPGNNTGFPLEEDMLPIYEDGLFTEGTWSLIPESLTSTDYDLELTGTGFTSGGEEDGTVRILKRPDNGGDWILDGMHVPGSGDVAKRSGLSGFHVLPMVGHVIIQLRFMLVLTRLYAKAVLQL